MKIADLHLRSDQLRDVLNERFAIGSGDYLTCYRIMDPIAKGEELAVKRFEDLKYLPVSEKDALLYSDIETKTYEFPKGRLYIDKCRVGSLTGESIYSGFVCRFIDGPTLLVKDPFTIKFETLFKSFSAIESGTMPVSKRKLLIDDDDLGNIIFTRGKFVHIDTVGFKKLSDDISVDDIQVKNIQMWTKIMANFLIQGFMVPFVSANSELSSKIHFNDGSGIRVAFSDYICGCSFNTPENLVGSIREELSRSCGKSVESIGAAKKILGMKK